MFLQETLSFSSIASLTSACSSFITCSFIIYTFPNVTTCQHCHFSNFPYLFIFDHPHPLLFYKNRLYNPVYVHHDPQPNGMFFFLLAVILLKWLCLNMFETSVMTTQLYFKKLCDTHEAFCFVLFLLQWPRKSKPHSKQLYINLYFTANVSMAHASQEAMGFLVSLRLEWRLSMSCKQRLGWHPSWTLQVAKGHPLKP